jgi:hypothetical protein
MSYKGWNRYRHRPTRLNSRCPWPSPHQFYQFTKTTNHHGWLGKSPHVYPCRKRASAIAWVFGTTTTDWCCTAYSPQGI